VLSLAQENVDVGLRLGALPDSCLVAIPVGATRRIVCASPAYLAARGTPRAPDDLLEHDCIKYSGFASQDAWTFLKGNTSIAVPVKARLTVGSAGAACDAACAGIGVTMSFAYSFQHALHSGALTTLLQEFQPPAQPVNFVYTADRFLPIKVRAFLDFAAPRLRKALAAY
jgi:DNA-binding transcriptional LysR family regulator